MFNKILIANRGEIALRIIRTCKVMGIKTVAVYSSADEDSLHVRFADEAICIGPAVATNSYLSIPAILTAARISGAEAIHPGYGFLAENAEFSAACSAASITFIGPTPEMIVAMGNKSQAKETVKQTGVPAVPGSDGIVESYEQAVEIAKDFPLPLIIKASAGGGGKGMRIVRDLADLQNQFALAKNEAEKAFANGDLYIEKYIDRPRHIEIQILGDRFGKVIHLGERDCSIQRRHQKLIEESPSPAVSPALRTQIGQAAVAVASAIHYEGAGTVEFLLDEDDSFYFMEMNTRIQVEHPVTEFVTGYDLIRYQIVIAAGEKLDIQTVKQRGHAIECRINAEDPEQNFRPSPGLITSWHQPGGFSIRVDSHVYQGYSIPPYYDSMIAKLIVHGATREEAIERMTAALDEFVIEGIKTTIPFHKRVMKNEQFRKGVFDTHFLESFE
jgi:acetyl-CoA carboxylase, biotin carboxylase subunit